MGGGTSWSGCFCGLPGGVGFPGCCERHTRVSRTSTMSSSGASLGEVDPLALSGLLRRNSFRALGIAFHTLCSTASVFASIPSRRWFATGTLESDQTRVSAAKQGRRGRWVAAQILYRDRCDLCEVAAPRAPPPSFPARRRARNARAP